MPATITNDFESTRGDLGRGLYGLRDLRAFLALSGLPQDAKQALPWLTHVLNPVAHRPKRYDYSFSDLISLFVVRELRKKGVELQTIRSAEQYLRVKWKTDRPFVSDQIQTDGRRVLVDDEVIAGQIEAADLHGQQVMRELIKDRLAHVHYQGGNAESWTPAKGILVDPRVQFGEPVIEGTRLTTEAVAATAKRMGLEATTSHLAVPLDAAKIALKFEEKLAALRE
ncbi:MAG TPA: hypothetical protein VFW38_01900 [Solirubrobacteraceae bacterium]|nr:hypothetical protein [Solirubrobacteraceae bacterium]